MWTMRARIFERNTNPFVKHMKWSHSLRETTWEWVWRIAILVLPWQTRLLWGGIPIVGKYVPEETMFSFYLSWIVLLAAIVLVYRSKNQYVLNGKMEFG